MAIRLDPEQTDAQGLPVVTWEEDRNLISGRARISCFIRPDQTGALQFVAAGPVRFGVFEEARPWERLVSFTVAKADELYYSTADRALIDIVTSRGKSGGARALAADGAFVILANFADERRSVPMHLNCADCTPVEIGMLHDRLRLEFLDRRAGVIERLCDGIPVWAKDRPYVAYKAASPASSRRGLAYLIDALIVAGLAFLGVGLFRFLGL